MIRQQEGFTGETGQQGGPSDTSENLIDLVRQLTHQGTHLAEQQLNLVQAEIRQASRDVMTAAGSFAGAAVAGIAGLGVVLMGLAYLLGDAIDDLGLATLIVGLATLAVAYFLYAAARKKLQSADLDAERTRRTLERAPDAIRGDLNTEHRR